MGETDRPDSTVCLRFCLLAVFSFLQAQKNLQITDISTATVTEEAVRLNYVHGIWYQVSATQCTQHTPQLSLSLSIHAPQPVAEPLQIATQLPSATGRMHI